MKESIEYNNLKKLMISCGGTGGHFYPGLSIAREFKKHGGDVLFCLSGKERLRQAEIVSNFGFESFTFDAPRLPRSPWEAITFFPKVLKAVFQIKKEMKKYRPNAVLSMGSFTSFPAALSAGMLKIPLFLHDGNARVGRANRFISRWCRCLSTAFPAVNADRCHCEVFCTGMPLRPELLFEKLPRGKAIAGFNEKYECKFKSDIPIVLIVGGSLGAASLNDVFPRACLDIPKDSLQIIHLTGEGKLDQVMQVYNETAVNFRAIASSPDMHLFFQAADVVICRSGGSTVAELGLFGKYALLIPYPFAAERHQDDNARFLTAAGGGEILFDNDCSHETALEFLRKVIDDPETYRAKGAASLATAKPNAASDLLKLIDTQLAG